MLRKSGVILMLATLAACGPAWAPPNAPTTPCETISEARYTQLREEGAAHGRARVYENGTVMLSNGPGITHCATFTSAMRPCRRPNEYVIEYTPPDGAKFYVHVPANAEYRFSANALPNTCQIVRMPGEPHRLVEPASN